MRPIRETIPVEEARGLLMEAGVPIDRIERAAIDNAAGRVLAGPVVSAIDVPRSIVAMHGYAVIAEARSVRAVMDRRFSGRSRRYTRVPRHRAGSRPANASRSPPAHLFLKVRTRL
jgi:molybdopterin biosynthesis enzyme